MWPSAVLTLCVVGTAFCISPDQLPKGFRLCSRNQPQEKIDECFTEACNENYQIIKDGSPEFGLPSLLQLKIPDMHLKVGNEAVGLSFQIDIQDPYMTYTAPKYLNAHVDFKKGTLDIDTFYKNLTIEGKHQSNGRFLIGSIRGEGRFRSIMHDATIHTKMIQSEVVKDGKIYWHTDECQLKIQPKRMTCNIENIVGSANKNVNEALNRVLNENWDTVFPPLFPDIERSTAPVFPKITNAILSKIPKDELFPDK